MDLEAVLKVLLSGKDRYHLPQQTSAPKRLESSTILCSESTFACSRTSGTSALPTAIVFVIRHGHTDVLPWSFDFVGMFFVDYTKFLVSFVEDCVSSLFNSRSLKVQYLLPQWFLHDTRATLTIAASAISASYLNVTRLRAGDSPILRFVRTLC